MVLTRVRMARICEDGRQDIAFDGFVRPVLLDLDDVTLPLIVTPSSVVRHSSKKAT